VCGPPRTRAREGSPLTGSTLRAVPSVEEIRAQRPPEATIVRWLSIVATVLWLPIIGHLYQQMALIAVVLYIFGAFGVAKGRQAARIMATIGLGITYLLLLPYLVVGFDDLYSTLYVLTDLAAAAVAAFSLVQMYHRNTSRYIHLVTVARSSPPPG
jgi:hypothetical protein